MTSPPAAAQPGQVFTLFLDFYNEQSGALTDPSVVQLDITYGSEVGFVPDVPGGGPFTYSGTADTGNPQPGILTRIAAGQYAFYWLPGTSLPGGVYVANWSCTYGPDGDVFLITEDFTMLGFATALPSGDTGYWTGSITYQPAWSQVPLSIPLGSTDASGITWRLNMVEGWDSPPAAVGQVVQRSADHGGWPTAQYYGPRILTLDVTAEAPTQALRDQARAQLQQAVSISDLCVFTYDEPVPKLAYVRRNAQAGITESYPNLIGVDFSIPLVAPDPRKYATVAQSASSQASSPAVPLSLPFSGGTPVTLANEVPPGTQGIAAVNSGTFETRPVVTVQGPAGAPAIVNASTGMAVSFSSLTLKSTDTLVLDMDARQAYLNGAFTPADSSSAWWVLEPGASVIYLTASGSNGSVISAQWSSAWI